MKLKLLPPSHLLLAIGLMVILHWLLPISEVISGWWKLIGILPLVIGVGLNVMADRQLHHAHTTVKPYEESDALVSDGVYRYSRHPMYLGFVFILLGVGCLLGSLSPFFVLPIFVIFMVRLFVVI